MKTKETRGITLIALVVTIIVLLILAGVAIAILLGENGIINRAGQAKEDSTMAEVEENIRLAYGHAQIGKLSKKDSKTFEAIMAEELEASYGSGNVTVVSQGTKGYKITINGVDYYYGGSTTPSGGGDEPQIPEEIETQTTTEYAEWTILSNMPTTGGFDGKVNMPKLGNQLKAVVLSSELEGKITNNKVSSDDVTWYDYIAQTGTTENGGTSKWGNAVTTDSNGDITGFYVWVPRYAYKITRKDETANTGYHQSGAGTIEIRFLKDGTNKFMEGNTEVTAKTSLTTADYDANGDQKEWLVHPAFTANAAAGGGFGEITGIWVAKFEMSALVNNGTTTQFTRDINGIAGDRKSVV